MCQTRAFQFTCGHVSTTRLSRCRGTYADLKSDAVLCKATPSIIISHPRRCQTCEYQVFYKGWETRIAAAHERRAVANHLLQEVLGESAFAEGSESSWDEDEDNSMDDYGFGFDDTQRIKTEAIRAAEEIDLLHRELRREQQTRLRSSSARLAPLDAEKSSRLRQRSSRVHGASPLKEIMTVEATDTTDEMSCLEEEDRGSSFGSMVDSSDDEGPSTPDSRLPNVFRLGEYGRKSGWPRKSVIETSEEDLDLEFPDYGVN